MGIGSEQSDDLSGTYIGRFHIVKRLGAGGMGQVYLAEDSQLRRTVAIKRMARRLSDDPRHRQRFLREAQTASRLNDPHIAAIYDVLERRGEIFLVMELIEGKTLRQSAGEAMKLDEFLPLAAQCVEGLAAAHKQGVVHRDIKPENIMVTPAGQVKILDFGLARRESVGEETVGFQTEPGSMSGTAGYMAPEALLEGKADARGDIFSLGVVFYEMLTGRHPFRAQTYTATSNRVLNEEPTPPSSVNPSVPAELDRIVGRMLSKQPADRYATVEELAADLKWVEQGGTAPTVAAVPRPRPPRPGRRRKLWIAGAVVVVAALVVAAIPQLRRTVGSWLGMGATVPGERQLAVLPFTAYNGTAAQQAFATGLTDTVTARLAELSANHALAVVPASSIFEKKVNSPDVARQEFGVNLVLTGSLQEAGGQIRVTYALVNTRTKRQLAARTETSSASDPFAVEDNVSRGVLDMLKVQLEPGERKTLEAKGTDKPGAYAFYLQGKGYLDNYEESENVANAIQVFQHALEIDPRYARAYAGLGLAYWKRYDQTQDTKWTVMSKQACARANAIDSKLAVAHNCLGQVANGTGKYEVAVHQYQQALVVQPTSDSAYQGLADAYDNLGRTTEAEKTYKKAIALRPQYWAGYHQLGVFYFLHGRYADAAKMFQQVMGLVPDGFSGYADLGAVYAQIGNFRKAVPLLKRSIAIRPNANAYTNLGVAKFYTHQYEEAAANFEKAVNMRPKDYGLWRNVGDGYYWAQGKRQQANAAYHKAIAAAKQALRVNPKDPDAYEILAVSSAMTGAREQALTAISKTVELAPENPEAMYSAAIVYTKLGDREKGMEWLKKAVAGGIPLARVRNEPVFDSLRSMKDFPGTSTGPQSN
jgi:tetratricopeptide (TPR) repeat protein/TolB-like protein/predicted Ser/Thr protein kinase